ncbi:regulator of G-protein signaling 22 [Genypterus blacodes]|uniref:regulator of G-protein signaling 22 n=1 Tax=Genypterus blacodes TaxID=154954 RepID=UPI003F7738C7
MDRTLPEVKNVWSHFNRLATLLSQWDSNMSVQRRQSSWRQIALSASPLCFATQFDKESENALHTLICSPTQENISGDQGSLRIPVLARPPSGQKQHLKHICTNFCDSRVDPCPFPMSSSSFPTSFFNLKCEKTPKLQSPLTGLSHDLMGEQRVLKECSRQNFDSSNQPLENVAARVVKLAIGNAVKLMDEFNKANTGDSFRELGDQTNCWTHTRSFPESKVSHGSVGENTESIEEKKENVPEDEIGSEEEGKTDEYKKNEELGSRGTDQESVLDICYHGACCYGSRLGLDEFKEFLQGTAGEKLLSLWMDIERLKTTQRREWKNRYLVLMRGRYLLGSSHSCLNVELLSTLGLTTSPCWIEEKLRSVQPSITEALLLYWAPRFRTSPYVQEDFDESLHEGLWTEKLLRPPASIHSHPRSITLAPIHPDTCLPLDPHTAQTQLFSSTSTRMDKMVHALYFDAHAGLYFTQFCEQSGNQLWENTINFWTDLQHYHELFYQDGLDPYRIQREAQLLYSIYLCSSARRSIGIDEEIRGEVYSQLMPAYEELFDAVAEHTLNTLLEPWALLLCRDRERFKQVCVQEQVRQVDSQEYRELQNLYEESEHQLKQVEQSLPSPLPPFLKALQEPDPWSDVPPRYHGYCLGSILRHRDEVQHFQSFLQSRGASIHLLCWLDLEEYRRTPKKDAALKHERSSHITTKYLSGEYLFGPDSPASAQQQSKIMHMAGGPEQMNVGFLSNPLCLEIQNVVRSHIEKTWLPLFLSTAEFSERHTKQLNKADGLWMSSSKEILLFRRILLNPVTCLQFQHFVSLKGDLLENNVLFWLEVQRYKDLCHSHSDEDTIQEKISTIIGCFVNSSMPPALQIDIPSEQAQHILDKRHELGPYIFREAQFSVFSALLKLWPEFQALRSTVKEEQFLPLLEQKRFKQRARLQRQRRKEEEEEEEERRIQEEMRRIDACITEEEEKEDNESQVEEEADESGDKELTSRNSSLPCSPQSMSWSYSKYMAALKREEVLLRRQTQLEASFSTTSDSSSTCSVRSTGSAASVSQPQLPRRSSRVNRKQYNSR